jgi:hypothetical protein
LANGGVSPRVAGLGTEASGFRNHFSDTLLSDSAGVGAGQVLAGAGAQDSAGKGKAKVQVCPGAVGAALVPGTTNESSSLRYHQRASRKRGALPHPLPLPPWLLCFPPSTLTLTSNP